MEALVKLLEGAEDAFVAKGALGAISSLVQGNPTNKLAVREANGIEVRPPTKVGDKGKMRVAPAFGRLVNELLQL